MRYIQPYGIEDPNAPYINGDPTFGRMGSIPPAEAFEHPQRELVSLIEMNKAVPIQEDLKQIGKSVRSQRANYCEDTGLVNALTVALDPPLTSYTVGLPLRVKVKMVNSGPSTIDAGAGRVAIRKPNGAEVAEGELPSGGLIELVFDGTNFQMINYTSGGLTAGDIYMVNVPYTVDSGTPNVIVANFSPAITAIQAGTMIMVKIANTNTNFATLNVNGLGAKPIYAAGWSPGWPMLPSDLIVGDVVIFTYDGTRWWHSANSIINVWAQFNVATNAEFDAIFVALARKRINSDVMVTIKLATGIWGPIATKHPNADRIAVRGTMKAAAPTFSDFNKTGYSAAARAQDSANNIAMLRTRYGTEIQFTNALIGYAVTHTGGGQIYFGDLLVTGPNVHAGISAGAYSAFAPYGGGMIYAQNCSIWGSGFYSFSSGVWSEYSKCFAVNGHHSGYYTAFGGGMALVESAAYGMLQVGIENVGGAAFFYRIVGAPGVTDVAGSQIMCCANAGVACAAMANFSAGAAGHNISNNAVDLSAWAMSSITVNPATVFATAVPAPGVVGNNNSLITVA